MKYWNENIQHMLCSFPELSFSILFSYAVLEILLLFKLALCYTVQVYLFLYLKLTKSLNE